jgi:hypothetical protein
LGCFELTHSWAGREEEIAKSTDAIILNLDERYTAAASKLDAEWQAPEKQQPYTKPSNKLLNLRVMLKGMLKARRFNDVDIIGRLIEDQQQRESLEANVKMQHDFEIADQRLLALSETERIGIEGKGDSLMHALLRSKELDLRPYYQRLDNLKRIREIEISNQKKIQCLEPKVATPESTAKLCATRIPAFVHSPRLIVPAFAPKRRPGSCTLPSQRRALCRPKTSIAPPLSAMGSR